VAAVFEEEFDEPQGEQPELTETGAWKLPSNYTSLFDAHLADELARVFANSSVYEFGAGSGRYVKHLMSAGTGVQVGAVSMCVRALGLPPHFLRLRAARLSWSTRSLVRTPLADCVCVCARTRHQCALHTGAFHSLKRTQLAHFSDVMISMTCCE
jgi:hypothetical protein